MAKTYDRSYTTDELQQITTTLIEGTFTNLPTDIPGQVLDKLPNDLVGLLGEIKPKQIIRIDNRDISDYVIKNTGIIGSTPFKNVNCISHTCPDTGSPTFYVKTELSEGTAYFIRPQKHLSPEEIQLEREKLIEEGKENDLTNIKDTTRIDEDHIYVVRT